MKSESREIEVKLRFATADEARERLEKTGARLTRERIFEDNVLFEREHDPLQARGEALRLRRVGTRSVLTFKGPVDHAGPYKVRIEHETPVDDADATEALLESLGYHSDYRYQKYRTEFELPGLDLCLDETPLGCFVELEGPPERIDAVARELGFNKEDYVRLSYRELHGEPGDLLL